MTTAVRTRELARHYGEIRAVEGLSLEISAGETFGLLGPNGAGKTTLLSLLATLSEPSSGEAEIFGHDLRADVAAVRRVVGLVPQQISLYPDLTGEENLEFFGRIHGIAPRVVRERCDRLLELAALGPRRSDRVKTYSGGMQRRLNLVCSLIHEPRLLLLDEPTVGVDPHSRDRIFETVESLSDSGITVIYTTHYMEEAERLCDRIAILDAGRLIAHGTLPELLEIVGMGEVIEIRVAEGSLGAHSLASLSEVHEIDEDGRTTRIFTGHAAAVLGPLASLLAERSARVERLEIHPVNLGRVFLHLTGHELRD